MKKIQQILIIPMLSWCIGWIVSTILFIIEINFFWNCLHFKTIKWQYSFYGYYSQYVYTTQLYNKNYKILLWCLKYIGRLNYVWNWYLIWRMLGRWILCSIQHRLQKLISYNIICQIVFIFFVYTVTAFFKRYGKLQQACDNVIAPIVALRILVANSVLMS